MKITTTLRFNNEYCLSLLEETTSVNHQLQLSDRLGNSVILEEEILGVIHKGTLDEVGYLDFIKANGINLKEKKGRFLINKKWLNKLRLSMTKYPDLDTYSLLPTKNKDTKGLFNLLSMMASEGLYKGIHGL